MNQASALPTGVGIGLKSSHVAQVIDQDAGVDFLEVHAENYMVAGGPFPRHLECVRARYALSIHGVGLSIGGDMPPDREHLGRLRYLLERFEPMWFSEHLAWSGHGGAFFNDLLPLVYNTSTLHRVCSHIDGVQQFLQCRLLLENPSTYVEYAASTLDEGTFLAEVVRRTGCGLLLDVNNAYVSAVNHGRDAWDLISVLPAQAIAEIHLAGFAEDRDAVGDRLLIDTHGAPVAETVWALYRRTLAHLGPVPTLIERDNNLPALHTLVAEAALAKGMLLDARAMQPASAREHTA